MWEKLYLHVHVALYPVKYCLKSVEKYSKGKIDKWAWTKEQEIM